MKKVLLFILQFVFQVSIIEAQVQISVGTVYSFTQAQSSTVDYLLSLDRPGQITLNISGWLSTYDWGADFDRIYIYNNEGTVIGQNSLSSAQDPFLFHMFGGSTGMVFNVGKSGVYTIKVHSGNRNSSWGSATSQNYQLSLTAIYCDDANEPNEEMLTATLIDIEETLTAYQWRQINTVQVNADEDWYQIIIPTPGVLKLTLLNWVATYNWGSDYDRLHVYNAAGTEIGFRGGNGCYSWMMGSANDTTPHVTEMNLSHSGKYFLRYHAGAGYSTTPYKLTTSFTPVNDIYEPNNSFETATLITDNSWYPAYEWRSIDSSMNVIGDEDYYYFVAPQAGSYSVTLNGWIPIYNWGADYDWLTVYDVNHNAVGANPLAWMMGTNPYNFNIPSAGTYFLRLHCGGTSSIQGYQIKLTGALVDVEDTTPLPKEFSLSQNFPNPFNPTTTIQYSIPKNEYVKIVLYNMLGKEVLTLVDKEMEAGSYDIKLTGNNLASGAYFYKMEAGNFIETKKLLLLK